MKTQTLQEAITYVLSIDTIANVINRMEAHPDRFLIASVAVGVMDYHQSILRVVINFREKPTLINIKEDVIIELQGTGLQNFKVLGIVGAELDPKF